MLSLLGIRARVLPMNGSATWRACIYPFPIFAMKASQLCMILHCVLIVCIASITLLTLPMYR